MQQVLVLVCFQETKGKTTPTNVNLMRSQELHRAEVQQTDCLTAVPSRRREYTTGSRKVCQLNQRLTVTFSLQLHKKIACIFEILKAKKGSAAERCKQKVAMLYTAFNSSSASTVL